MSGVFVKIGVDVVRDTHHENLGKGPIRCGSQAAAVTHLIRLSEEHILKVGPVAVQHSLLCVLYCGYWERSTLRQTFKQHHIVEGKTRQHSDNETTAKIRLNINRDRGDLPGEVPVSGTLHCSHYMWVDRVKAPEASRQVLQSVGQLGVTCSHVRGEKGHYHYCLVGCGVHCGHQRVPHSQGSVLQHLSTLVDGFNAATLCFLV